MIVRHPKQCLATLIHNGADNNYLMDGEETHEISLVSVDSSASPFTRYCSPYG